MTIVETFPTHSAHAKKVRVIKPDHSGHFAGKTAPAEWAAYDFANGPEFVVVHGELVNTFEDFLRVTAEADASEPEVQFIAKMQGGA